MMAVHHNAKRPAAYLTSTASVTSEDDDRSVCGVVYVAADAELGAAQLKPSQSSSSESAPIRPSAHPVSPPRLENCRNRKTWVYTAFGCAVLLAIIIAIAVGTRRKNPGTTVSPKTTDSAIQATETTPTVLIVPFSIRAAVASPAGANYYSCDDMFGTDQVISRYITKLQAAFAAQISPPGDATVHITQITCDAVTYHSATDAAAPVAAAADSSRQLQLSAQGGAQLDLLTNIEVWLRDQSTGPPVGKETAWMTGVRRSATEVSQSVITQVLADVFRTTTVLSSSIQIVQLPAVIISSSSPASAGNATAGQSVVTRATTDPFTGEVTSTQTIQLPEYPSMGASSNVEQPDGSKAPTKAPAACPQGCSLSNAVSECVNSQCVITKCQPGWEDCDSQADNGCEVSVLGYFTDSAHCGGCHKVCLAPLTCVGGACALPASSRNNTQSTQAQADAVPAPSSSSSSGSNSSTGPGTARPPAPPPATDQQQPPQRPADKPANISTTAPKPQPDDDSSSVTLSPTPDGDSVAVPPSSGVLPQPEPEIQENFVLGAPVVYDDLVRITPHDSKLVIDVLANDNLGGHALQDVTLSNIIQPAQGTARVIPADLTAKSGSAESRPRIEYVADGAVAAGQEVQLYYTVALKGESDTPAPAAVTVLGAVSQPDQSLLDCSTISSTVVAEVLSDLSHADDASQVVTLPFPVLLFGTNYTQATVSSNGWVSLGNSRAAEPCTVVTAWPGAPCLGSGPVLAVFWDDLVPDSVLTYYHKNLGAFIIQWTNVMFAGSSTPLGTFQAYIFQNGTVGYVYRDLFGDEESLGSGAVIGLRGPSSNSAEVASLLQQRQFTEVGSTADPHGSWYFAAALDVPDYVATAAAQLRVLNPGLAIISHTGGQAPSKPLEQQPDVGPLSDSREESSTGGLGDFGLWSLTSSRTTLPLLVATNSPPRPIILQPAGRSTAGSAGQVLTVAWKMPSGAPAVQQFRLYVAADPLFAVMLRQPAGIAFERDIPGSTRSVDIVLDRQYAERDVYALLFACYDKLCRKSCTAQLRPKVEAKSSVEDSLPRPSLL